MNNVEKLKGFKSLVGRFHEEMKSNSVTDLIVWIDCVLEKEEKLRKERAQPGR